MAYVLRSFDTPQWYYVSDHDVQQIKEATVMASQAYILMYERISTGLDQCEGEIEAGVVPIVPDENRSDKSEDEDHQAEEDTGNSADPIATCPEATEVVAVNCATCSIESI